MEKKSIKMNILVKYVKTLILIGILDIILDDFVINAYCSINRIFLLIKLKLLVATVEKKLK